MDIKGFHRLHVNASRGDTSTRSDHPNYSARRLGDPDMSSLFSPQALSCISVYIDVWQLHVNANYDRKINHLLGIKIKTNYYYWDQEISHKPNLTFDFISGGKARVRWTGGLLVVRMKQATLVALRFPSSRQRLLFLAPFLRLLLCHPLVRLVFPLLLSQ